MCWKNTKEKISKAVNFFYALTQREHIIHNGEAVGTGANLPDSRIRFKKNLTMNY